MKVTRIEKLMLSGHSTVTNNSNEADENTAKIPTLWDEYFDQNIYQKTFDKSEKNYMYGIYSDYEDKNNGNYKMTIAVEVKKPKKALVIQDEKYLVFSKKGELPNIIFDTWDEILEYFDNEPKYERAFKVDFEKYLSEDEIEIYISIL